MKGWFYSMLNSESNTKETDNTEVAKALVNLIRTIVRDEIAKTKGYEKYKDGVVVSVSGDSVVVNINDEKYTVPNKSGTDIKAKAPVRVFYGDKYMTDAYIGTAL